MNRLLPDLLNLVTEYCTPGRLEAYRWVLTCGLHFPRYGNIGGDIFLRYLNYFVEDEREWAMTLLNKYPKERISFNGKQYMAIPFPYMLSEDVLYRSAELGLMSLVRKLLKPNDKCYIFGIMCYVGHLDIAKLCFGEGLLDNYAATRLVCKAAEKGHLEIVMMILCHHEAFDSALDGACQGKHIPIIDHLQKNYPSLKVNRVVEYAVPEHHWGLLRYLDEKKFPFSACGRYLLYEALNDGPEV